MQNLIYGTFEDRMYFSIPGNEFKGKETKA
jgi:hypothetical protein